MYPSSFCYSLINITIFAMLHNNKKKHNSKQKGGVAFYGRMINSNHLVLIYGMPMFQFVNKSIRQLLLRVNSDSYGFSMDCG